MWSFLAHIFGIDNPAGPQYAFFSGIGADLGELAIVGGLISLVRKHHCHVHHCFRIGRFPVEGTPWIVCRKHNPDDAPTAADVTNQSNNQPNN